jgi:hypothetical protein
MSPTPIVLAALATSCRILSNTNQLKLSDKKEVFEFHLQWLYLAARYRNLATEEVSREIDDLAHRMARFVVNHETRRSP